jgi:signal transduction histidine kinase/CheY-like chemotaxis protein
MASEPIRILLIEDNPGDAALLTELLAAAGPALYQLTHVKTLSEASALLDRQRFDLILLDLSLPDSQGLRTVQRTCSLAPETAIIVLTGDAGPIDLEALRHGAQDYLLKGRFDTDLLVRAIRHAIERKAGERRLKRAEEALQAANDHLERMVEKRTAELRMVVEALQTEVRQRQSAQADLLRANQALQTVTAASEAILRADNERDLLNEICQIVIKVGGYRMVWVGYAHDDKCKNILPAASIGFEDGYLERAKVTWAEDERGRGPTGTAVRTGRPAVGSNFATDAQLAPWREEALRSGFGSSVALPLMHRGRAFGALTVYAAKPAAFDQTQVRLLAQLADDLAFAIIALRAQAERDRAQQALRESQQEVLSATEREQRRIGRDLHDSIQGNLAGIGMMLGAMKRRLVQGAEPEAALPALDDIEEAVNQTIAQTRGLARGLCPLELKDRGLMKALDLLASTTSGLFRVDCKFQCDQPVAIDDETAATQLYYIAQEALNNALKHARASKIVIALARQNGEMSVEVRDDGVGLPAERASQKGMGLRTMNYRAQMIGAQLAIAPAAPAGTVVRCSWGGAEPEIRSSKS